MNTAKDALMIGAAGAATLTFVGWSLRKALGVRQWRPTTGRVISAEVRKTDVLADGDANIDVVVRFAYTVDGREYTADRLGLFTEHARYGTMGGATAHAARLTPGTEIPVWYDPSNPADAVSDRSVPKGYWIAGVIGALLLLGAIVAVARGVVASSSPA
jgi:uncharacterized protein DUF3592